MTRPDHKGRRRSPPFVMVYQTLMDTDAWRSLPGNAVKLLLHLIRLAKIDNGASSQRGHLFLSERDAAKAIGVSRNTAAAGFAALVDRGFVAPVRLGHFKVKAGDRELRATTWRLTFQVYPQANMGPTNDYRRWQSKTDCRAQKFSEPGANIEPSRRSELETGPEIAPAILPSREGSSRQRSSIIEPHIDMPRAVGREPSGDEFIASAEKLGTMMAIRLEEAGR